MMRQHPVRFLVIGASAVIASVFAPATISSRSSTVGGIQSAFASCGSWTSIFGGSDTAMSNASTVQIHINTESPTVCSDSQGPSYWDMVVGPSGCKGNAYAQNGWLVGQGGSYGPYYFEEINGVNFCDPGPDIWGTISGTNYYETQLTHTSEVNFWKDGTLFTTDSIDWNTGTRYQIMAEAHDPNDYFSTNTSVYFSGAVSCEGTTQCNPHTYLTLQPNPGTHQGHSQYDRYGTTYNAVVCDTRIISC